MKPTLYKTFSFSDENILIAITIGYVLYYKVTVRFLKSKHSIKYNES